MAQPRIPFANIHVALPTPFDDRGKVDQQTLDRLLKYILAQEIFGLALLTEAAEDAYLLPDERRSVIEGVNKVVGDKKQLMVNIGAPWTREAVDLARFAEQNGASSLLISVPRTPGIGYRELYRHLDRICRATSADTAKYLVVRPENAVEALSPEEQATLAAYEGLSGCFLPEAGPTVVAQWARRFRDRAADVMNGCALRFSESARSGATSAVCGLSMLAPKAGSQAMEAIRRGDVDTIRRLEKRTKAAVELLGPPRAMEDLEGVKRLAARLTKNRYEGSALPASVPPSLIKQGLKLQGHTIKSYVRPPQPQVNQEDSDRLKSVLKSSGILS